MSTTPLTDAINSLTTYANEVTGASDTNLSDAVATLASGYGSGSGYDLEDLLNKTEPSGRIVTSNVTQIPQYFFNANTGITSIFGSGVTSIGTQAFRNCTNLITAVFPDVVSLPGQYILSYCASLTGADFGASLTRIGQAMFERSTSFNTLIIRSASVPTFDSTNIFIYTCFKEGNAGGTIYVPSSLISSYEENSVISTVLGWNSNNRIVAIEGSIYETQYVDGTPIS